MFNMQGKIYKQFTSSSISKIELRIISDNEKQHITILREGNWIRGPGEWKEEMKR